MRLGGRSCAVSSRYGRQAAHAAMYGAIATKSMTASIGRVVHIGMQDDWEEEILDASVWRLAGFCLVISTGQGCWGGRCNKGNRAGYCGCCESDPA